MHAENLKKHFYKDLARVQDELHLYKSEAAIWTVTDRISNSTGNLCLHLIGNLHANIGTGLAKTGYIRQRPLEFSEQNISRKALLQQLDAVQLVVANGWDSLSESQLSEPFPLDSWPKTHSTEYVLLLLLAHLNYHLGQINYHRRLLASA